MLTTHRPRISVTGLHWVMRLCLPLGIQREDAGVTLGLIGLGSIGRRGAISSDIPQGGFQPSSDVYVLHPVILPPLYRYAHL
jgi:hypothetical protein